MFKTARSALEHTLGGRVPDDNPVLPWLVKHVACLRNRYYVGSDGLMPWGRVVGKRLEKAVAEFGNSVVFLTKGPRKKKQWPFGTWLGLVIGAHEALNGTPQGIAPAWTTERTGEQSGLQFNDLLAIRGTMQRPDAGREGRKVPIRIVAVRVPTELPAPPGGGSTSGEECRLHPEE